jgi:hypothetical protein
VPIVNFDTSGGRSSIPIAGFAEFYLDPSADPSKGNLNGCYLQNTTPESTGSSGAPNLGSVSAPIIIR